jgi:branched-chain amino acid aminotransferase
MAAESRVAYVSGEFRPETEASVSVYDLGVLYGQMVFEFSRTFGLKPFRMEHHLIRLFASMKYSGIDCGMTIEEMNDITNEVIERNKHLLADGDDYGIWHNVSAGPMEFQAEAVRDGFGPTVIISVWPISLTKPVQWKLYDEGINAIITAQRSVPARLIDPKVKNRSRMHYRMADLQAAKVREGAWALLTDEDGFITEGSGANFMIVRDGQLVSPEPRNTLRGVTRGAIIELAASQGIPFVEANIDAYDVYNAAEAFYCSTSFAIMPVITVDGHQLSEAVPGPVTQRLTDAFADDAGIDFVAQAKTLHGIA